MKLNGDTMSDNVSYQTSIEFGGAFCPASIAGGVQDAPAWKNGQRHGVSTRHVYIKQQTRYVNTPSYFRGRMNTKWGMPHPSKRKNDHHQWVQPEMGRGTAYPHSGAYARSSGYVNTLPLSCGLASRSGSRSLDCGRSFAPNARKPLTWMTNRAVKSALLTRRVSVRLAYRHPMPGWLRRGVSLGLADAVALPFAWLAGFAFGFRLRMAFPWS